MNCVPQIWCSSTYCCSFCCVNMDWVMSIPIIPFQNSFSALFCFTNTVINLIKPNIFARHWPNERKKKAFQHFRVLTCSLRFVEFFFWQMPVWMLFKCRKAARWLSPVLSKAVWVKTLISYPRGSQLRHCVTSVHVCPESKSVYLISGSHGHVEIL